MLGLPGVFKRHPPRDLGRLGTSKRHTLRVGPPGLFKLDLAGFGAGCRKLPIWSIWTAFGPRCPKIVPRLHIRSFWPSTNPSEGLAARWWPKTLGRALGLPGLFNQPLRGGLSRLFQCGQVDARIHTEPGVAGFFLFKRTFPRICTL